VPLLLALATLGEMTQIEMILFAECGQGKYGKHNRGMIPLAVSKTNFAYGNATLYLLHHPRNQGKHNLCWLHFC